MDILAHLKSLDHGITNFMKKKTNAMNKSCASLPELFLKYKTDTVHSGTFVMPGEMGTLYNK